MSFFDPRELENILDENRYFYNQELSIDQDNGTLRYKGILLIEGFEIDSYPMSGQHIWIGFDREQERAEVWQATAHDSHDRTYTVEWCYEEPEWYENLTEDEKRNDMMTRSDFEDFADWEHPIRIWIME